MEEENRASPEMDDEVADGVPYDIQEVTFGQGGEETLSTTIIIVIIVSCVLFAIITVISLSIVLIKQRTYQKRNPINPGGPPAAEEAYTSRMYDILCYILCYSSSKTIIGDKTLTICYKFPT